MKKQQIEKRLESINKSIRKHMEALDELRNNRKALEEELDVFKRAEKRKEREENQELSLQLMREYIQGSSIAQIAKRHGKCTITIETKIKRIWRDKFSAHNRAMHERYGWDRTGLWTLREHPPLM